MALNFNLYFLIYFYSIEVPFVKSEAVYVCIKTKSVTAFSPNPSMDDTF